MDVRRTRKVSMARHQMWCVDIVTFVGIIEQVLELEPGVIEEAVGVIRVDIAPPFGVIMDRRQVDFARLIKLCGVRERSFNG